MKKGYLQMLPSMLMINILGRLGLRNVLANVLQKFPNSPFVKRQAFGNYSATKHDVFICTYAKSGTNWTMQIVNLITNLGEQPEFEHIHDVIPWPDAPMPSIQAKLKHKATYLDTPTQLRGIKTHLEAEFVPYNAHAKYIVVFRDPKDVFVSSYFFGTGILAVTNAKFTVEQWLTRFLNNQFLFGSWAKHMSSYWEWRNQPNVMLMQFEDMKRDLRAAISQIANFMGVELTDTQHASIVRQSEFAYMKAMHDKFEPNFPKMGKLFAPPLMLREGKSGNSGSLLSQAQQAQIDAFCQAELERIGSDFPYTSYFDIVTADTI